MPDAPRCRICGAILTPPRRSYCSDKCAAEGRKHSKRVKVRKPHPPVLLYYERPCMDCGKIVRMHIKSKRCPDCQCAADNAHNADFRRARAAGHTRQLGSIDRCAICGAEYVVKGGKQKYCPDCAPAAYKTAANALSSVWNLRTYADADKREARNAARRSNFRAISRSCVICGQDFLPETPRRRTCSEACHVEDKRRRQRIADAKRERRKKK